ncbi:MAG: ribonuclease Z [Nitrospinae bacterium]|nr:ribonuclease Z [Nitrospinota bacterium]
MRLHLLGTGSCAPSPTRAPAGYFLEAGGGTFLVDPGPGAVHRATVAGCAPLSVDAVVVTHHHLDHVSDLLPWLFSARHCAGEREARSIPIIAPVGFAAVFAAMRAPFEQWIGAGEGFDAVVTEMAPGDMIAVAGVTITTAKMNHGANALAYRFDDGGGAFVYSGDTGFCDELASLAKGADLLLAECSHPDGWEGEGHLTPATLARIAIDADVPRLVVTHMTPAMERRLVLPTENRGGEDAGGRAREGGEKAGASLTPAMERLDVAALLRSHGYKGELTVGEDGMTVMIASATVR